MPRLSAQAPDLAISPDGSWLAVLTQRSLRLYDLNAKAASASAPGTDSSPAGTDLQGAPVAEFPAPGPVAHIGFLAPDRLLLIWPYDEATPAPEGPPAQEAAKAVVPAPFLLPSGVPFGAFPKGAETTAAGSATPAEAKSGLFAALLTAPGLKRAGSTVKLPGASRVLTINPVGAVVTPLSPGADVLTLRNGELGVARMFLRGDALSAVPTLERRWLIELRTGFEVWDPSVRRSVARLTLGTRQQPDQIGTAGRMIWALSNGAPLQLDVFRSSDGLRLFEVSQPGRALRAESGPGRLVIAVDAGADGQRLIDVDLSNAQVRRVALPPGGAQPPLAFAVRQRATEPEVLALFTGPDEAERDAPRIVRLPLLRLAGARDEVVESQPTPMPGEKKKVRGWRPGAPRPVVPAERRGSSEQPAEADDGAVTEAGGDREEAEEQDGAADQAAEAGDGGPAAREDSAEARSAAVADREARSAAVADREARSAAAMNREARDPQALTLDDASAARRPLPLAPTTSDGSRSQPQQPGVRASAQGERAQGQSLGQLRGQLIREPSSRLREPQPQRSEQQRGEPAAPSARGGLGGPAGSRLGQRPAPRDPIDEDPGDAGPMRSPFRPGRPVPRVTDEPQQTTESATRAPGGAAAERQRILGARPPEAQRVVTAQPPERAPQTAAEWQWALIRWSERERSGPQSYAPPPSPPGHILPLLVERLRLAPMGERVLVLLYAVQRLTGAAQKGSFPAHLARALASPGEEPALLGELLPGAPLRAACAEDGAGRLRLRGAVLDLLGGALRCQAAPAPVAAPQPLEAGLWSVDLRADEVAAALVGRTGQPVLRPAADPGTAKALRRAVGAAELLGAVLVLHRLPPALSAALGTGAAAPVVLCGPPAPAEEPARTGQQPRPLVL